MTYPAIPWVVGPEQFLFYPFDAGPVANAVTVHPRILRMCAQLLGTRDMRIQQSELWYVLAHPLAPPLDLTCSLGAESCSGQGQVRGLRPAAADRAG